MRHYDIIAQLARRAGALLLTLAMLLCCAPALAGDEAAPYPLLTLVNCWNPLPEGYEPELVSIGDGHKIDARAYSDYRRMMADCRAAGLKPVVRSSYRTQSHQTALYLNKVHRVMATLDEPCALTARAEAATVVAYPGTSEHQLGLALDIVDSRYQALETDQENTPVQQWLMRNSWRYGFILRYPTGKSDITGIIYEPWHYRYVGRDAADEIYHSGLCLEEYIAGRISSFSCEVPLALSPVCHIYAPIARLF